MAHLTYSMAFGASHAKNFRSAKEAVCDAHRIVPGLIDFDFPDSDNFHYKRSIVNLNGLPVAAVSSSTSRLHVDVRPEPVLLWSLSGDINVKSGGFRASAKHKQSAIFIPKGWPTEVDCTDHSMVLVRFDPLRLKDILQVMLGDRWDDRLAQVLGDPHGIFLRTEGFDHDMAFRRLFAIIDAWGRQEAMRDSTRLDETLYRAVIMAMFPAQFVGAQAGSSSRCLDTPRLDLARDHVMANLAKPLTSTDLERVSGFSQPDLRQAFARAHGMSPMAWVKRQRVLARRAPIKKT